MRKSAVGESDEYPPRLSYPQLLALHVAANYELRRCSMGWWADGHLWGEGEYTRVHSQATIKSLLKMGLLDGNDRGKNVAREGWDGKSTMKPPIPKLWASGRGNRLLKEISENSGWVFDKAKYCLMQQASLAGINLGCFDTELEAALAVDRAAVLILGDAAETHYPPEESEHLIFPDDIMRQINAVKEGWTLH